MKRLSISVVILTLACLAAGHLYGAKIDREFQVFVTDPSGSGSYQPGTQETFTIELTNYLLSGQNNSISFIQITLPPGFTLASVAKPITLSTKGLSQWKQPYAVSGGGTIITLNAVNNNSLALPPNGKLYIYVTANTPSTCGSAPWGIYADQEDSGGKLTGHVFAQNNNANTLTCGLTNSHLKLNLSYAQQSGSSVTVIYKSTTNVTLTATLTGPTQSEAVDFTYGGGAAVCTGVQTTVTPPSTDWVATCAFGVSALPVDHYPVAASFQGAPGFSSSSDSSGNVTVSADGTTLAVGSTSGSYGGTVNLSATLTSGLGAPLTGQTIVFSMGALSKTPVCGAPLPTCPVTVSVLNPDGITYSAVATMSGVQIPTDATGGTNHDYIQGDFAATTSYNAATGNGDLTITSGAPQHITFGPILNQVYGNPPVSITAKSDSKLQVSFSPTGPCSLSNLTFDSATGASGALVTLTGATAPNTSCTITATQIDPTGIFTDATPVAQSFTIGQAALTAGVTGASPRVYDGTRISSATCSITSGIVPSDSVGCAVSSATFADANVATSKPVTATIYLIGSTLSNYYLLSSTATTSASITARPATWTTSPNSKTYGIADPNPLTSGSGTFLAADVVTATYSRVSGETVTGGPYHITATLSATGLLTNYTITNAGADFTISARPATWTTNANSKTYGDADPTPLTTGSGNFVAADNVTATYGRVSGETVGTYHITATLAPDTVLSNYTITNAGADFTIGKRLATWTTVAAGKTYGDADPTPLTTGSGNFVAADNVTATYGRVSGETVGTYHITATLSPADMLTNYTITNAGADFTIGKRLATWTTNPNSKTYFTADPSPLTTGSGNFVAADNVTASYSRVSGETVGTYHITATLNPATVLTNYTITNAGNSFTINMTDQSITFGPIADKPFGTDFTVSATASSGLTVSFGASGVCTITGTTVHPTAQGVCTITASQAGDSNYFAAASVSQPVNITTLTQSITFTSFTVVAKASSGGAVTFTVQDPGTGPVCTLGVTEAVMVSGQPTGEYKTVVTLNNAASNAWAQCKVVANQQPISTGYLPVQAPVVLGTQP